MLYSMLKLTGLHAECIVCCDSVGNDEVAIGSGSAMKYVVMTDVVAIAVMQYS